MGMIDEGGYRPDCVACKANAGLLQAPGGVIYQDALWRLEHILSPAPLAGWLVLKPKRHCEGLDFLTVAEAAALGPLMRRVSGALRAATGAEKIYSILLAEGVAHVHFHLIPRRPDLPMDVRGPRIFDLLRRAAEAGKSVPDAEAAAMAEVVRHQLDAARG
jgi:diadenosine tetraphosphate (Ap4A) HIT family hydrolase